MPSLFRVTACPPYPMRGRIDLGCVGVISSVEAGAGVAIATEAFSHAFGHRVKLLRLTPERKAFSIGIAAPKTAT